MIEAYVGPEAFRRGVSSYLKRFSYSNASGEDFWAEMTRVTGKPVDQILKSFVDQPGIPLLSVESIDSGGSTEIKFDAAAVLARRRPRARPRRKRGRCRSASSRGPANRAARC